MAVWLNVYVNVLLGRPRLSPNQRLCGRLTQVTGRLRLEQPRLNLSSVLDHFSFNFCLLISITLQIGLCWDHHINRTPTLSWIGKGYREFCTENRLHLSLFRFSFPFFPVIPVALFFSSE